MATLSRRPKRDLSDLNLYAYVNNEPLNLTDPMGTEPVNSAGAMAALLGGQQNAQNNPINANAGATQVADASTVMTMCARAAGAAASASPLGAAVIATMVILTPSPVADGTCASGGCGALMNSLGPVPDADGPHTTWKGPLVDIGRHETWVPNPKNPSGWDSDKATGLKGKGHFDKKSGQNVPTPHTHMPDGSTRPATPDEIPK